MAMAVIYIMRLLGGRGWLSAGCNNMAIWIFWYFFIFFSFVYLLRVFVNLIFLFLFYLTFILFTLYFTVSCGFWCVDIVVVFVAVARILYIIIIFVYTRMCIWEMIMTMLLKACFVYSWFSFFLFAFYSH